MTQDPQPSSCKLDKRCKYDKTFKVEALRLASGSLSPQAVARQLGISKKLVFC